MTPNAHGQEAWVAGKASTSLGTGRLFSETVYQFILPLAAYVCSDCSTSLAMPVSVKLSRLPIQQACCSKTSCMMESFRLFPGEEISVSGRLFPLMA